MATRVPGNPASASAPQLTQLRNTQLEFIAKLIGQSCLSARDFQLCRFDQTPRSNSFGYILGVSFCTAHGCNTEWMYPLARQESEIKKACGPCPESHIPPPHALRPRTLHSRLVIKERRMCLISCYVHMCYVHVRYVHARYAQDWLPKSAVCVQSCVTSTCVTSTCVTSTSCQIFPVQKNRQCS